MLRRFITLLSIILILIPSAAAKEKEELKIGDPAPEFILKDADDKEYSLKLLIEKDKELGKAVILMMGDRKVQKEANKWATELDKIYGKKKEVVLLMIADLRGLPFFVTEGMVKWGTKREKLPVPIVLDWKGKISKMYYKQKGKVDIFVVDGEGKIAYHYVGSHSEEAIKKLTMKIQDMLKEKADSPKEDGSEEEKGA